MQYTREASSLQEKKKKREKEVEGELAKALVELLQSYHIDWSKGHLKQPRSNGYAIYVGDEESGKGKKREERGRKEGGGAGEGEERGRGEGGKRTERGRGRR